MHDATSEAAQVATDSPAAADGSGAMFDRIARRYDRLNRILSLGMDRRWRRRAAAALVASASSKATAAPTQPHRVLDVATGTGDLALETLSRFPEATLDGIDPAPQMLAIAREKAARRLVSPERLTLHEGHAEALPFADGTFDGATIAFGIRNVTDRSASLRELARVVRPGGRVVILELVEPRGYSPVTLGAKLWVHVVVPRLGAWLSSSREYRYLQRSIEAFPPPRDFAEMMQREAGLTEVHVRKLAFGSVALFSATVPEA